MSLGKVVDVVQSKDDVIRHDTVQCQNASESMKGETDRADRSIIKLFNIDDKNWCQEMAKVSVHRGSKVEFQMFDKSWQTSIENEEMSEYTTIIPSSDGLASLLCATKLDLDLETLNCLGTAKLANGGVASAVSRLFLR